MLLVNHDGFFHSGILLSTTERAARGCERPDLMVNLVVERPVYPMHPGTGEGLPTQLVAVFAVTVEVLSVAVPAT